MQGEDQTGDQTGGSSRQPDNGHVTDISNHRSVLYCIYAEYNGFWFSTNNNLKDF